MIQPEWGTKRTCPKCATRFYDLGKNDPVTCIECSNTFQPETILKSKQPMAYEIVKADPAKDAALAGGDEDTEALAADDGEPSADDEVDLGGDDDLGVETNKEDDES
ncbi:TIGR02300 family protein [uncultured Sphingomonas sp.]|uniref:TIGR02300 family protein n=1 Tax=uncultured Sphingomonas sp. TaxID=158754 RepID=UPI0035CBF1EC